MNFLQTWGSITVNSLESLWIGVIGFLPNLIGALVILIIGWILAIALGRLTVQILNALRVDQAVERIGFKRGMKKAGVSISATKALGQIVTWFLIVVFVMAAADILKLTGITDFLTQVLYYVPNIIAAVIILLVAILVANFLSKVVRSSVRLAGLVSSNALAEITKWAVLIFALFAALDQLGVATTIINTLITGFVYMIVIAGGLAFGLGAKDHASDIFKKIRSIKD